MVEFVGRLHKAGVPLLAGTDAIAGFTLHSELALYVKAGLSPAQVLQIATRDASHHSGTTPDRGRIAVGKRADLVLVDGNPLANIADLRNVALVVTQGNAISPNAVHQALGVAPFVKNPPTLKRIEPAAGGVRVGDGSGQRHGPSGAVHLH